MPVLSEPNFESLDLKQRVFLTSGNDFTHAGAAAGKAFKMSDGPAGVRGSQVFGSGGSAVFPSPSALACCFDQGLMYTIGQEYGRECKSKGAAMFLGPNLNLARDPRGGRNFEVYGEDPVVAGLLGAALIDGIQSEGVGACAKHLICNDAETKRKVYDVIVDEETLHEVYLRPFSLACSRPESTPWAVMTAYNTVNGVQCTEDKAMIDVIRRHAARDLIVMSDWFGTVDGINALRAGCDLEMPFPVQRGMKLLKALEQGSSSSVKRGQSDLMTYLNTSAERMFNLQRKCCSAIVEEEESTRDTDELRQVLLKGAVESAVLLKNDRSTLPLDRQSIKRIAIVGELAVRPTMTGRSAHLTPLPSRSPLECIQGIARTAGIETSYDRGVRTSQMFAVPRAATSGDGFTLGSIELEYFDPVGTSIRCEKIATSQFSAMGNPIENMPPNWTYELRTTLEIDSVDKLFVSISSPADCSILVNGEKRFDYDAMYVTTEQFIFNQHMNNVAFDLGKFELGQRIDVCIKGKATVERSGGEPTPQGCRVGFEMADRRLPEVDIERAVDSARGSDLVLVFVGNHEEWESEGFDRLDLKLQGAQDQLVEALAKGVQPAQLVVVNQSSSAVDLTSWLDKVDAVLHMGLAGNEVGQAVAGILFGDETPSGKLGFTWPKRIEDVASFAHFPCDANDRLHYAEGRHVGYRHFDRADGPEPLFPFGFGLAYTKFEYEPARLTRCEDEETMTVSLSVTNVGKMAGRESVQLYITSPDASLPVQELKAFQKTTMLEPQQSETLTFDLELKTTFGRWSMERQEWTILPGSYEIRIAASSRDIRSRLSVQL